VLEDETERGGAVIGLDVIDNLALELVVLRMVRGSLVRREERGSDLARVQTVGGNPRRKI